MMRSQTGPKAILVTAALLLLLAVGAHCASAQAEGGAPADPSDAAASTEVVAPSATISVSLYVNPIWLAILAANLAAWLYLTSWISNDSRGVGLAHSFWSAITLGAGLLGLLCALFIHIACAFLIVVFTGVVLGFYVLKRNAVVPEQHRFLGATQRNRFFAKIPFLGKVASTTPEFRASTVDVALSNAQGRSLDDVVAENTSLGKGADVFGRLVVQAFSTNSRVARVFPHGGGYVVQMTMDAVSHDVEALESESGQQTMACASLFLGLTKGGRVRQGSARFTAGHPTRGNMEITAHIVSSDGRPALVLDFPDWTSDLYKKGLEALGMHEALIRRVKAALNEARGAFIIAGPPGSGKSTTLLAAVGAIDIFTTDVMALLEDQPQLDQVRNWPFTRSKPFEQVYHEIMREGPNAILFDDFDRRDQATALLEFASEDGKLLATIEAGSAPAALVGLAKLSAAPDLVSRAVTCVLSQRLVRKLCPRCRRPMEPHPGVLQRLGIDPAEAGTWYGAVGCEACLQSGYRGRIALFSMLIPTDPVKAALAKPGVTAAVLRQAAGETALRTLYQDGLTKIAAGVTTLEEVQRVLKADKAGRKQGNGSPE